MRALLRERRVVCLLLWLLLERLLLERLLLELAVAGIVR